jgi:hypothetical protein
VSKLFKSNSVERLLLIRITTASELIASTKLVTTVLLVLLFFKVEIRVVFKSILSEFIFLRGRSFFTKITRPIVFYFFFLSLFVFSQSGVDIVNSSHLALLSEGTDEPISK